MTSTRVSRSRGASVIAATGASRCIMTSRPVMTHAPVCRNCFTQTIVTVNYIRHSDAGSISFCCLVNADLHLTQEKENRNSEMSREHSSKGALNIGCRLLKRNLLIQPELMFLINVNFGRASKLHVPAKARLATVARERRGPISQRKC